MTASRAAAKETSVEAAGVRQLKSPLAPVGGLGLLPSGSTGRKNSLIGPLRCDRRRVRPITHQVSTLSILCLPDGYVRSIQRISAPLTPPLPDGVDARDLWVRELQQPPLSLIQEGDSSPVYGHDEVVLRHRRT